MNAVMSPDRPTAAPASEIGAAAGLPRPPRVSQILPPDSLIDALVGAAIKLSLRTMFKPLVGPPWPVSMQRAVLHGLSTLMPPAGGVEIRHQAVPRAEDCLLGEGRETGHVPAERLRVSGSQPRHAILFLHGGAFCAGSPRSHRSITTRLARLTGAEVLAPHYRRTPEHPFPAQIEDGVAAYRQLLADGYAPERIALVGDSAGGSLSLLVPMALRQLGLPRPGALVLMSPAVDLSGTSRSMQERRSRDPMIRTGWVRTARDWLAVPHDHPLASPLAQHYADLPPTLVQVGTEEVLFDDARQFVDRAAAGGAPVVELEICEQRWHVFQIHAGVMPSATQALERQAAFLARHWAA